MTGPTEDAAACDRIKRGAADHNPPRRVKIVIAPGTGSKHYWRDLWHYRELLYFLAWRDIAVRYKQTAIGIVWVLIRPALTMVVFVGFRRLAGLPAGAVPDPILVAAAVLPWQFCSSALTEAAGSLVANANLVTKIYFPRLIIPFAAVTTSLVDFCITLALLALLMLWYGLAPSWQVIALPAFMLTAFGFSLGCGLLLAALNVQYRDFRYVIPFVVQLGLFISPIAFSSADVPERWRMVYALNPLAGIIDGFRWSLFGGRVPLDPETAAISVIVTAAMLVVGIWYFRRMEHGFADLV